MVSRIASGETPQAILTPIFEDERHRLSEALSGLVLGLALPVGARDLGTIGDKPLAVSLDYGHEFVMHLDARSTSEMYDRARYLIGQAIQRSIADWLEAHRRRGASLLFASYTSQAPR